MRRSRSSACTWACARSSRWLINPVWSRLSDRRGNKLVMQLATARGRDHDGVGGLRARGGAAGSTRRPSSIAYLFVPVFALIGIYETGVGIGAVNLTLEIAPGYDRAIYIGLTNTVLGVAYFSTSGQRPALSMSIGYEGVFVLGLILLAWRVWALWRLHDPRELTPSESPGQTNA